MPVASPPQGYTRHRADVAPAGLLPGPGRAWAALVPLVIAAGVLPVLALWWQNTLPGSLNTTGDYLAAAGRIAGLLAAYLLLVLVALMARIPWVENRLGSDVAARYHRTLGEYTVALAFAHATLIILGYAQQTGTNPVSETVTVVVSYTDVWLSAIALGLLVTVGVVSARKVRRRISYESWYFVHLLVYVAIATAFAHEFAVGTEFSTSARNRVLWSGAHIVVAAAVVVFRVCVPVTRSLRHDLRVSKVVREGPQTVSIHMTGRQLEGLGAQPGQFLRWRFLAPGLWWQSHPYSLSAVPSVRGLRITVKDLGDSSRALARLRPGTRVWFEGPYGAFTPARRRVIPGIRRGCLLIAAGAGITPIRALYEALPGRGSDVILVYRASRPQDLVLYKELEAIARRRGFGLYPVVGSRTEHGDPFSGEHLLRVAPDIRHRDVFLCGPPGLVESTTAHLRRIGVRPGHIHAESFDL